MNKYLALESILADCQHGFRSQRSCETQLVQFQYDLVSNLDRAVNRGHKQTNVIVKDYCRFSPLNTYLALTITDNLDWGQQISELHAGQLRLWVLFETF